MSWAHKGPDLGTESPQPPNPVWYAASMDGNDQALAQIYPLNGLAVGF